MKPSLAALAAMLAALAVELPAWAAPDPSTAKGRLAALETQLDTHDSATAVLQDWCDAHGSAPGTKIVVRMEPGAAKPPTALVAQALHAGPDTAVHYRRVDLMCGDLVLSRADNWYLPAELTPAMNQTLDQSQTPFGVVVAPLHFTRHNLQTDILFKDWDATLPEAVLRHAAVLLAASGEPFSVVVETYTRAVLAY